MARSTCFGLIAFGLLLAAAFPVRIRIPVLVFGSFSTLDLALVVAAPLTAFVLLVSHKRLSLGDTRAFVLLAIPVVLSVLSLAWTSDIAMTVLQIGFFSEALLAYWVLANVLAGIKPDTIMAGVGAFVILLLVGSVLSLVGVPGFVPEVYGADPTSAEYLDYLASYYSRLSHPFYGLSNDYASVLALFVFPLLTWGFIQRRAAYLVIAGITAAAVAMTLSRGVLAALVAGWLILLIGERRRVLAWTPGLVMGAALAGLVIGIYLQVNQAVLTYLPSRFSAVNIGYRLQSFEVGLERIADKPILGYGAGVLPDPELVIARGVHNTFLQQMLYYGVPLGSLVAVSLLLLVLRFLRWRDPRPPMRLFAFSVAVALFVQMLIFLVETSFEAALPKMAFYVFVAISISVLRRASACPSLPSTSG